MNPIELINIPGGTFLMGSSTGRDDERPVHRVDLKSFRIARFPVTNQQYAEFLSDSKFPNSASTVLDSFNDPLQPVTGVSWFDAIAFCEWIAKKTGVLYRLPTEAEWEYAACGGDSANVYPWGTRMWDCMPELHSRFQDGPEKVGGFEPNAFGIHDMGMNVHEWCSDWYDFNYYSSSPEFDPRGPESGTRRSSRGGSWRHQIKITRCSARSSIPPAMRYADYGFRVCA
jgi:formylglycine-generating enzyme required for sulfatase activity